MNFNNGFGSSNSLVENLHFEPPYAFQSPVYLSSEDTHLAPVAYAITREKSNGNQSKQQDINSSGLGQAEPGNNITSETINSTVPTPVMAEPVSGHHHIIQEGSTTNIKRRISRLADISSNEPIDGCQDGSSAKVRFEVFGCEISCSKCCTCKSCYIMGHSMERRPIYICYPCCIFW